MTDTDPTERIAHELQELRYVLRQHLLPIHWVLMPNSHKAINLHHLRELVLERRGDLWAVVGIAPDNKKVFEAKFDSLPDARNSLIRLVHGFTRLAPRGSARDAK